MEWSKEGASKVLRGFAAQYGDLRLRENCYSHLLFSEFRKVFGDRFMVGVGFGTRHALGEQREGRQDPETHGFRKSSMEFFPDLVVLPLELSKMGVKGMCDIKELKDAGCPLPTALFEWKFNWTFKNMGRKHARLDAKKLQLMGDYVAAVSGQRPLLVQGFFGFEPEQSAAYKKKVQGWFSEGHFSEQVPDVDRILIYRDGAGMGHVESL